MAIIDALTAAQLQTVSQMLKQMLDIGITRTDEVKKRIDDRLVKQHKLLQQQREVEFCPHCSPQVALSVIRIDGETLLQCKKCRWSRLEVADHG